MTVDNVRTAKSRSALTSACRVLLVVSLLIAITAGTTVAAPSRVGENAQPTTPQPTNSALLIQNVGQFDPEAQFLLKQGGKSIWLTKTAIWLTVPDQAPATAQPELGVTRGSRALREKASSAAPRSGTAIRFTFAGANPAPRLEPLNAVPTHVSYLTGSSPADWHSDVPVWSGVRYKDLYPGIDLVIGDGEAGAVPWRLEAQPGADLNAVSLRTEGAETVTADAGRLQLGLKGQKVDVALPSWSLADGSGRIASAAGQNAGDGSFAILPEPSLRAAALASQAAPDALTDLIYDASLTGSLDGNADDTGYGIAVDYAGNAYVTGQTRSANLPVTPGAYDPHNDGGDDPADAFVAKLNVAGTSYIYVTYMGGTGFEAGSGIAVTGNLAFVAGITSSTSFAGTTGNGDRDMFVAALNATGTNVQYVRRLAGTLDDEGFGIALEGLEAYVVGTSSSADFPQPATNCAPSTGTNLVVAKLNTSGAPVYTTCLAGALNESGAGIAVRSGVAYVTGDSSALDYSASDMLVASFAANGAAGAPHLIGGTDFDWGSGIAVDGTGSLYIAGGTSSTNFPITSGARGRSGGSDAVVLKIQPDLTTVDFATYLGGSGDDDASGIAVDTAPAFYVVGTTLSGNFPATPGAYNTLSNGGNDVFVARMQLSSSDPAKLTYATYLGDAFGDFGLGVATDTGGNAFVTGTRGVTNDDGSGDARIAKLKVSSPPTPAPVLSIAVGAIPADASLSWTWSGTGTVAGYQLLRSSEPYFKPGDWGSLLLPDPTASPYPDNGALTTVGAYFYLVKPVDSTPAAGPSSNQVGKFTFPLVKGG